LTQSNYQAPDKIVDVSPFLVDEAIVYQEGARDKSSFKWDDRIQRNSFCVPSHLYMFKHSRKTYPEQFWVEIFAYHFGNIINVAVPRTFAAVDINTGIHGALIEWFYDDKNDTYLRGGDIMQSLNPSYDRKKGKQHNFESIIKYCRNLGNISYWLDAWAKIIVFDALMGNTDRHQENWGIVNRNAKLPQLIQKLELSPAFDNGTSMGVEIAIGNFAKFDSNKLDSYVRKGFPHMMWDSSQQYDARDNHTNFVIKFVMAYPDYVPVIMNCLNFATKDVKSILEYLCEFNVGCRLSPERAEFMIKLIDYRRNTLLEALDQI
jgi:hypothetical protein